MEKSRKSFAEMIKGNPLLCDARYQLLRRDVDEIIVPGLSPEEENQELRQFIRKLQAEVLRQDYLFAESKKAIKELRETTSELKNRVWARKTVEENEEILELQKVLCSKLIKIADFEVEMQSTEEENVRLNDLLLDVLRLVTEAEDNHYDNEIIREFALKIYEAVESSVM